MRQLVFFTFALCACGEWAADPDGFTDTDHALISGMVLPDAPPADPTNIYVHNVAAQQLGQALFYDRSLSSSGTVSCATCHDPRYGFMDNRQPNLVSQGVSPDGSVAFTKRNSLGLLDAAFYTWWGWDGRSDSLWMQCGVAYELPSTMSGSALKLTQTIQSNTNDLNLYRAMQATAGDGRPVLDPFQDPDQNRVAANVFKAFAAYITELVMVDSAFDRYAAGDDGALTPDAKRGLKLFLGDAGCITCHNGAALNGSSQARTDQDYFRTIGIGQRVGANVPPTDKGRFGGIQALLGETDTKSTNDLAVFNTEGPYNDAPRSADGRQLDRVAGLRAQMAPSASDLGRFRIKGLRNVALTAPYMHAGQLATLDDVVHFYNGGGDDSGFSGTRDRQLQPLQLSETQLSDLVSFLESLTGRPLECDLTCDPLNLQDAGITNCRDCGK
jgi:cytochrome c peroxidase